MAIAGLCKDTAVPLLPAGVASLYPPAVNPGLSFKCQTPAKLFVRLKTAPAVDAGGSGWPQCITMVWSALLPLISSTFTQTSANLLVASQRSNWQGSSIGSLPGTCRL